MLSGKSGSRYDDAEVKRRTAEVASFYLGPPATDEGARLVWTCPACGKERKLSLRKEDQLFGCFKDDCLLHGADVFTFIGYMDGLDARGGFVEVLRRGYEILGLEKTASASSRRQGSLAAPPTTNAAAREASTHRQQPTPKELEERRELCWRVNARIMELCPLEERDTRYLRERGLTYETIEQGRFGSISARRAGHLKQVLLEEFGERELLSVPGFSKDAPSGRITFTFTGDYLLIPYHDRHGSVTNIEGRVMGEIPRKMGKYVSLRGSGNHLYLFPTLASEPERIEAFTEGTFGAVLAAQSGIVVGSIQGCKRYTASFSSFAPDGEKGEPLIELSGVSFRGRTIPYIPDADDPPNHDVINAAPKAAHHLIERHGGNATLCTLPRGMDLDEWLLSLQKDERRERFRRLVSEAMPLAKAEEWKSSWAAGELPGSGGQKKPGPDTRKAPGGAEETKHESDAGDAAHVPDSTIPTTAQPVSSRPREQQEQDDADAAPSEEEHSGPQEHARAEEEQDGEHEPSARTPTGAERLRDRIYRALMQRCPPKGEHRGALRRLGVMEQAIDYASLGSLDKDRMERVAAELVQEFGNKQLLSVPGFESGGSGNVSLSLPATREYVLLPFYTSFEPEEGSPGSAKSQGTGSRGHSGSVRLLTAIEVIEYDPEKEEFPNPDRTITLKGAGASLYVFPAFGPCEIEGFCEGPLAAMVAAQEDVVLGATGHFKRYTADHGSAANTERVGAVLRQLEGVDFEGRQITYVPASGPTEQRARAAEAHAACHHLIERQNGSRRLLFPSSTDAGSSQEDDRREHTGQHESSPEEESPQAEEHAEEERSTERSSDPRQPNSLLEYLLGVDAGERQEQLRIFFPRSPRRKQTADPQPQTASGATTQPEGDDNSPFAYRTPHPLWLAGMLLAFIGAAFVSHVLLGRLESFSQYVGVGYDGQPFTGGGTLGVLRRFASSGPFEILYAHRLLVSLCCGALGALMVFACWAAWCRRQNLAARMRCFYEGSWQADLRTLYEVELAGEEGAAPMRAREISSRNTSKTPSKNCSKSENSSNASQIDKLHPALRAVLRAVLSIETLQGLGAGVVVYVLLRLIFGLLGRLYVALHSAGMSSAGYEHFFASSAELTWLCAVGCALYVASRRLSIRRQALKLERGEIEP